MTSKKAILSAFILLAIKIILTNIFASNGMEIYNLETKIVSVEKENRTLNKEVSQLSSLSRISFEAQNLGFNYSGIVANLTSEIPIALR